MCQVYQDWRLQFPWVSAVSLGNGAISLADSIHGALDLDAMLSFSAFIFWYNLHIMDHSVSRESAQLSV